MDMPQHPASSGPEAEALLMQEIENDFPGWGVWRSGTHRWWAFRTAANPLTIEQLRAGRRLIVQADTVQALREAISAELDDPVSESAEWDRPGSDHP